LGPLFGVLLQVLMHSSQLSLLTTCAEVITNAMYPLSWCHVYIPILPRQCLYIPINSPVPYVLGFHTDAFNTIRNQLPDTVVIVDLDHNQVCSHLLYAAPTHLVYMQHKVISCVCMQPGGRGGGGHRAAASGTKARQAAEDAQGARESV
jgi:hypothetical protein